MYVLIEINQVIKKMSSTHMLCNIIIMYVHNKRLMVKVCMFIPTFIITFCKLNIKSESFPREENLFRVKNYPREDNLFRLQCVQGKKLFCEIRARNVSTARKFISFKIWVREEN